MLTLSINIANLILPINIATSRYQHSIISKTPRWNELYVGWYVFGSIWVQTFFLLELYIYHNSLQLKYKDSDALSNAVHNVGNNSSEILTLKVLYQYLIYFWTWNSRRKYLHKQKTTISFPTKSTNCFRTVLSYPTQVPLEHQMFQISAVLPNTGTTGAPNVPDQCCPAQHRYHWSIKCSRPVLSCPTQVPLERQMFQTSAVLSNTGTTGAPNVPDQCCHVCLRLFSVRTLKWPSKQLKYWIEFKDSQRSGRVSG